MKKCQAIYKASYNGSIGEAIYVNTNVTEFNIEKPYWVKNVYIDVNNTWTVVVWFNENTSTTARSGEIKISAKNNPELFVIVYVSQVGA